MLSTIGRAASGRSPGPRAETDLAAGQATTAAPKVGCCKKKAAKTEATAEARPPRASSPQRTESGCAAPPAPAYRTPASAPACAGRTRPPSSGAPDQAAPANAGADAEAHLAALAHLPQYSHPFVEGCTCGGGVIGCCPCTVGLAEHGAMQAGGAHASLMLGAGALGLAGIYLGGRAITTNLEAGRRVTRARAHNEERLGTLRAMQHRLRPTPTAAARANEATRLADAAVQALLRGQVNAARRRQRAFADSWADRQFNLWVPGVLQVVGSTAMVLAGLQHGLGLLASAPNFGALATGVLAGYAGLYAGRLLWRTATAWRTLRATRLAQTIEPQDPVRVRALAAARTALARQAACALSWTALAACSTAVTLLPPLGVGAGLTLGAATLAAQLAAVATSVAWPLPVHTPSTPRLDEAFAAGALDDAGLRRAWLAACDAQIDAVRACSGRLLAGDGPRATRHRLAHALEPWTTPQCGPRAYAAVANVFADQLGSDGAWSAGVADAVAEVLGHEADWLDAVRGVQARRARALARAGTQPSYARDGVAALAAEVERSHADIGARLAAVQAAQRGWQNAAAEAAHDPAARRALMLHTAGALGLIGEVAGGFVHRRPDWFYAAPDAGRLAFGHVVLRPECATELAEAMGEALPHAFVRCLLNPNRLVAERAELLEAAAAFAPPRAEQEPSVATAQAAADAGFGGCSSCA